MVLSIVPGRGSSAFEIVPGPDVHPAHSGDTRCDAFDVSVFLDSVLACPSWLSLQRLVGDEHNIQ